MRNKIALKIYARNANAFSFFILNDFFDSNFWNDLKDLLTVLKFIHDHQKMSESNKATVDQVYVKWIEIQKHLTRCIAHNRHENAIQKFLKTLFDIRFNIQMHTMHRVVYYLHSFRVKESLKQQMMTEIVVFMKQYVFRDDWSFMKNAFYDFRE